MTDPKVYCDKCGLSRNVMLHMRAEFPPDAAFRWMKKHHNKDCDGKILYMAGLAMRGPITGQATTQ